MQSLDKTREQLLEEVVAMGQRISELEATEARLLGTEKALRDSEERFRLLYEYAPLGYQSLDENGYFLEVNQAWLDTLGYSDLVLADDDLPDQFRSDLERILLAGRNGADLVQRLLTFSRKTGTRPLDLDLNQRIRQTQKFLQRTIPKMSDIELMLAEDLAAINADPTQIEQILMNLAVNARDAMPNGGKLLIETQNASLDEDYCGMHLGATPGDYVLLQFSDTGQGMDRDTLEHIFEPFYTTKGPGEGTGLGLAMVYGIVEQHGGHITCYSEPGRGTMFKIFFPALSSPSQAERAPLKPTLRGGTETILLVDDEVFIRDLGERILNRVGYTVVTAANGSEALAVYKSRQNEIALVILDLIMPEMGESNVSKKYSRSAHRPRC